jgi:hypothetical protein
MKAPSMHLVRKAGLALGGMVVGSIVGDGVQASLQSVGLGGPSVDTLIADQQANFADVDAKLDALRDLSSTPQLKQTVAELSTLMQRQADLTKKANDELRTLAEQSQATKDEQLHKSGMAGGADLWLKPGESVNVGDRNQVLAVVRTPRGYADINLSGKQRRLAIGDLVEVQASGRSCKVFFKQAARKTDGRAGFDLHCTS